MLTENDILWNLNNPLSKAHMNDYDDDTGCFVLPQSIMVKQNNNLNKIENNNINYYSLNKIEIIIF
jgi:hypothetical protein